MVLFVVSTWGEGKGGHFNTLATYIKATEKKYHILVAGGTIPPILREFELNITLIELSIIPKIKVDKHIEIIHCFDQWSYLYGFIYALKLSKTKLILTKSGGVNTTWFPKAENMWLVSKENYDYYSNFKTVHNIAYYDNRITDFDLVDVSNLKGKFQNKKIILRVGRISEYYRQSFDKMMYYSRKHKGFKFVVIGSSESETLYNELVSSGITILNDLEYTMKARKYLGLADLFIGQGRSAMEAIYKGIPTFVYNKKNNDLELVDINNIENIKFQNFSERASFNSPYNLENYIKVLDIKIGTNLKKHVEYDSSRVISFYDSLETKKVKLRSFPIILFFRYLLRIIKMSV